MDAEFFAYSDVGGRAAFDWVCWRILVCDMLFSDAAVDALSLA